MLNLEYIDIEDGCHILASTVRRQKCFHFDSRCQAAMDDLARASRIKADLALNPITSNLELEVLCEDGAIQVKGKAFSPEQIKEVEHVTQQVEGVTKVSVEELALPTPD